ncbi:MAG: HAD family hydrolase [Tepidiformaceae bacterium]
MARIILFDIDMTLIRSQGAGRAALNEAFRDAFGLESATENVSFDGRTDRAILGEIIAQHDLGPDVDEAYARVSEAYLLTLSASLSERPGVVLPGVETLLPLLQQSHGAIGLATGNMRRGAETKLTHYGLWHWFSGGGFGDNTPVRAEVVAAGMRDMAAVLGIDADPRETIVIGDTPLDVEAAQAAGARTLAVATGSHTADGLRTSGADWVLDDLSDTDAVMRLLAG